MANDKDKDKDDKKPKKDDVVPPPAPAPVRVVPTSVVSVTPPLPTAPAPPGVNMRTITYPADDRPIFEVHEPAQQMQLCRCLQTTLPQGSRDMTPAQSLKLTWHLVQPIGSTTVAARWVAGVYTFNIEGYADH